MGELSYECTLSQFEKEITFSAAMMAYVVSMMVEDVDVVNGKASSHSIARLARQLTHMLTYSQHLQQAL